MSEHVSQAEFAKNNGWSSSYVSQLKSAGRLVLTESGKVDVDASLQRISATADPNRDDVVVRNASARSQAPGTPSDERVSGGYQAARAIKEHYLARQHKLDYERSAGLVVEKSEALAVIGDVCVTLRQALESMPHMVAPVLVGKDQDAIRATLKEEINIRLKEMERSFTEQVRQLGEVQA